MVKDQFISVCDPELTLFLKERDPKTLEEAKLLADRYLDARLFKRSSAKTQSVTNFVEGENKSQYNSTSYSKMDSKMVGQGGVYATQKAPMASDRRCFICNKGVISLVTAGVDLVMWHLTRLKRRNLLM